MRKLLPLYILFVLLCTACSISTSDNGKLDGFWHLVGVDTLQDGHGTADLSGQRIFWAVQAKLLNVRNIDTDGLGVYFRFRHEGDSLILSDPYDNGWHEDTGTGDTPISDPSELYHFGVRHLEEHFFIEKLSGSNMILRSPQLRLYFEKM